MVTLATDDGSTEADLNMVVMASAIPWLGFVVVGALCLRSSQLGTACKSMRKGFADSVFISPYHEVGDHE